MAGLVIHPSSEDAETLLHLALAFFFAFFSILFSFIVLVAGFFVCFLLSMPLLIALLLIYIGWERRGNIPESAID